MVSMKTELGEYEGNKDSLEKIMNKVVDKKEIRQ